MKKILHKLEEFLDWGGVKKDIILLVISGIAVLLNFIFDECHVACSFPLAWISVVLCGVPILLEAIIGLITSFDIKADVLVSIAIVASIITQEIFAAGEVAFIMQVGGLLEELTVAKARAGIEKLVKLTPRTARVIRDNQEIIVAAEDVQVGDILRVLPDETIAVDGVIINGQTSVNQAVMTGESLPVDKGEGDDVSSGTVNQFGSFTMKATKVGEDSSIQRMIRLVQSADASKAKIVSLADHWATWVVIIALSAAGITWAVTKQIVRAVTILVVFCPCSLVLATPTAIMAGIGNVTKHGFLVRQGDALERLASVKKITFDKTGTLTYGQPEVKEVIALCGSQDLLWQKVASLEHNSEHPLGQAIVKSYKGELLPMTDFTMIPGQGVQGSLNGVTLLAGNLAMMEAHQITISTDIASQVTFFQKQGATVVYVAEQTLIGLIVLSDTPREASQEMIARLKKYGVTPVLLTGDNSDSAYTVAQKLGIEEVYAHCTPEDKLNTIHDLESKQERVCMIGDGVNDAPALKAATVGIAMGGIGSDIAVDAADIVLVDDEVKELPHLISFSKHMMNIIRLNLTFSMTLNFVAIVLAITGILNPVVGALVHNAGSVLVIVNSAFLLHYHKKD